jgi:exodeoxyribonuclease-5
MLGDKIVCRQNNWNEEVHGIYLTNGLIGYITDISRKSAHKGFFTISFCPTFMEDEFEDIKLDLKYIRSDYGTRKNFGLTKYEKFEYAYAVTCHSMQGSAADRVLYIDEQFMDKDTTKKLRYTAITRAKKSITFVLDGNRYVKYY